MLLKVVKNYKQPKQSTMDACFSFQSSSEVLAFAKREIDKVYNTDIIHLQHIALNNGKNNIKTTILITFSYKWYSLGHIDSLLSPLSIFQSPTHLHNPSSFMSYVYVNSFKYLYKIQDPNMRRKMIHVFLNCTCFDSYAVLQLHCVGIPVEVWLRDLWVRALKCATLQFYFQLFQVASILISMQERLIYVPTNRV